jgi:hypothetical protein
MPDTPLLGAFESSECAPASVPLAMPQPKLGGVPTVLDLVSRPRNGPPEARPPA